MTCIRRTPSSDPAVSQRGSQVHLSISSCVTNARRCLCSLGRLTQCSSRRTPTKVQPYPGLSFVLSFAMFFGIRLFYSRVENMPFRETSRRPSSITVGISGCIRLRSVSGDHPETRPDQCWALQPTAVAKLVRHL
ncbi:hypothetical protein OH77DRAFT_130279 [Trametes cingulata]|nr:hypothetical protein OH77DRAFT_130279 [Trametes cingulata]